MRLFDMNDKVSNLLEKLRVEKGICHPKGSKALLQINGAEL